MVLVTNHAGLIGFGRPFASPLEKDVPRGPAKELLDAIQEAANRFDLIGPRLCREPFVVKAASREKNGVRARLPSGRGR